MRAVLFSYDDSGKFVPESKLQADSISEDFRLVLCFASKKLLNNPCFFPDLTKSFSGSEILICSTAGEIHQNEVREGTAVIVGMSFRNTRISTSSVKMGNGGNSYDLGVKLIRKLPTEGLSYVMVFSDGNLVNGSELVKGINETCSAGVLVTGGLAGDANEFKSTCIGINGLPEPGMVAAVGFYGDRISVNHGTGGGWENFGPERKVTRSAGNVLYEIDGQPALELYKKFLGPESHNLPSSALLFPLSVKFSENSKSVVRTILSIDELTGSMTFAGDIPEGSSARFMKSSFDKLTQAASDSALSSLKNGSPAPDFSMVISCVGRKIIMGHRVEEEVEVINEQLGKNTVIAGFYSYGEIAPFEDEYVCQLHNQTVSITSFYET